MLAVVWYRESIVWINRIIRVSIWFVWIFIKASVHVSNVPDFDAKKNGIYNTCSYISTYVYIMDGIAF